MEMLAVSTREGSRRIFDLGFSNFPTVVRSLIDILERWASQRGTRPLYTFLADSEGEIEITATFAEVAGRARALGALLQERGFEGERVVLLFPPGLDFIQAFLGCLYGGAVAVPAVPPRGGRGAEQLRGLLADARPRAILSTREIGGRIAQWGEALPDSGAIERLVPEDADEGLASRWRSPALDGRDPAFLQYTSGSTSAPKGVVVSHGNLLANESLISAAFAQREDSVVVGWLPAYHDMGLIGNLLQPLFVGGRSVQMSPMTFLQRPRRWLEAITRFGGTTSGGPNFAYDLCVAKVPEAEREGLDLSSWRVAFNGAEPVRAETLERFATAFAGVGFRREAFLSCYGLAEATLLVSGARRQERTLQLAASEIERHRVREASEGEAARTVVGCGEPQQPVAIVDPESREPMEPGRIGEIWVTGPSVARGYWGRVEESEQTFGARLADGHGPFLRTGDLGFLDRGELFVTGRLKDLVIVRGRNHYPQDIERTAERSHPALRPGCGAAFAVDEEGEERLVVVHEVDRHYRGDLPAVARTLRQEVSREHELPVWEVVLIRHGTIAKTTSGKIRRRRCREMRESGDLAVLATLRGGEAPGLEPVEEAAARREAAGPAERAICRAFAEVLGVARVGPDDDFFALGGHSLLAAQAAARIERLLGVPVAASALFEAPTVASLVRHLAASHREALGAAVVASWPERPQEVPLSSSQQRFFFLHQLRPESAAYHIAFALDVPGALDGAALGAALDAIVARHEILRTSFVGRGDHWRQEVSGEMPGVSAIDLGALPEGVWEAEGERIERSFARRPFAPGNAPLYRFAAVRIGLAASRLLGVFHHTIADGSSLEIFGRELAELYEAGLQGRPALLAALPCQYADFAAWQQRSLAEGRFDGQLAYWRGVFGGGEAPLDLATDLPRPTVQRFRGGRIPFRLGELRHRAVVETLAGSGRTLFMALIAAYAALLARLSGVPAIVVGSPVANRRRVDLEPLIGCFVNSLALRLAVSREASSEEILARARETALSAFDHQDLPFERLVEALVPERQLDRSPLFQAVFVLQRLRREAPRTGAFAGRGREIPTGTSKLDLLLEIDASEADLPGYLEYDSDLFDRATATRLVERYFRLLDRMVAAPDWPLGELALLSPAESHQLLAEWNDTAKPFGTTLLAQHPFERQAELRPDAIAISCGEEHLSYRGLDESANRLARHLVRRGVNVESRVGLCLARTPRIHVAILGVLKAGATYVPLEPTYPPERLRILMDDSAAGFLLTEERWLGLLGEAAREVIDLDRAAPAVARESAAPPPCRADPDNLAYVIFTSGSTGRPKGAALPHRAVVNFTRSVAELPGLSSETVFPFLTTTAFDMSVLEIYLPLALGARLEVLDRDAALDGQVLKRRLELCGATLLEGTPATWRLLLDAGWMPWRGFQGLIGGEALPRDLVAELLAGGVDLINMYGPTETACWSAAERVASSEAVLLGRPFLETRFYVVDAGGEAVPQGATGELRIGGASVARGYWGRPDLTADRFVPEPWGDKAGARVYRTGDLVRQTPSGRMEFLGRADHQVKVRGYRIELEEIEACLIAHPQVRQAVVVARRLSGQDRLVAYVVGAAAPEALVALLRSRLPEYMVPAAFVELEALPLNPNGKVDRRALPEPAIAAPAARLSVPLRGPVEEVLAAIWGNLLGVDGVGPEDGFFALGGTSLQATRAVVRANEALGSRLAVRDLFETPTVAGLAARIATAAAPPAPPLRARSGGAPEVASFAQERLWFLSQLDPESTAYNMAGSVRLEGELSPVRLAAAATALVARHAILRTTFSVERGQPVPVVAPGAAIPFPRVDLTGAGRPGEAECRRLVDGLSLEAYDLQRGPVFRFLLVERAPRAFTFALGLHHVAGDGWSLGILMRETAALYRALAEGKPHPLPAPLLSYHDFAAWQREWLGGGVLDEQLAYWRTELADAPTLALPVDLSGAAAAGRRGATRDLFFPANLAAALADGGRRRAATPFMVLSAAVHSLLHRLSGQSDICLGTPIAGRQKTELEGIVGPFVNTLVLRQRSLDELSFEALLAREREAAIAAFAHQDLPFELLVDDLGIERNLTHPPLFQVLIAFQDAAAGAELELPGIRTEEVLQGFGGAQFDLVFSFRPGQGTLRGRLEYRNKIEPATAERWCGHLVRLLAGALARPDLPIGSLDLLAPEERHQVLWEWRQGEDLPLRRRGLDERFAEQAARTPDRIALVGDGGAVSYGEAWRRAGFLARRLAGAGLGPESTVGVAVERSIEQWLAILGVLRAGAAYLPLEPGLPGDRLHLMIRDARASGVVVAPGVTLDLDDAVLVVPIDALAADPRRLSEPEGSLRPEASSERAAYTIFTSGSTGRPKGVVVSHRAIANRLLWMRDALGVGAEDHVVQKTSFSFDASIWEAFVPWLAGGTVVVAHPEGHRDPSYLVGLIEREQATVLQLVPSMLAPFLAEVGVGRCVSLRRLFCGGEALAATLPRPLSERLPGAELYNLYGPTEAAIDATHRRCLPSENLKGASVPLGRPIANVATAILDPWGEPVPIGVPGELRIGGAGLARGYLGHPRLTAESFVPDPFSGRPGARLYRTGDLARFLPNGEIEFLGRLDRQVKVRGFRIELGEIEGVLIHHATVREAAVEVRTDGGDRLVAYVSPVPGAVLEPEALRGFARTSLPEHMVPSEWTILPHLPRTASGKLDRGGLAALRRAPRETSRALRSSTVTEQILAGIWEELLDRRDFGAGDDFFEWGGHSLLATQVVSRVREAFGIDLALRQIFEAPKLGELATRIDAARRGGEDVRPAEREADAVPPPTPGRRPLSFAQERFWFLDRLEPGDPAYNLSAAVSLEGAFLPAALDAALDRVAARHEVLRGRVEEGSGGLALAIADRAVSRLPSVDLARFSAAGAAEETERLAAGEALRPFDLARGPLWRGLVAYGGHQRQTLLLSFHHLVADGWSMGILVREAAAGYVAAARREPLALPPLPFQYGDYAERQRRALAGGGLERGLAHWRRELEGAPQTLDLPTDRPRPGRPSSRGGSLAVRVAGETAASVRALARAEGATPYMVLLAGFSLLLGRASGQTDLVVGTPVANRTRAELEKLIGPFVNTLALRVAWGRAATVRELVAAIRQTVLAASDHQEIPFEKVVEALQPERDLGRTPLVQVQLALHNLPRAPLGLAGLELALLPLRRRASQLELTLELEEEDGAFVGLLEYAAELFDPASVRRLADRFVRLLDALVADAGRAPGAVPWMAEAEIHQLVVEANDTERARPVGALLADRILARAAAAPQALAVIAGEVEMSYAELARRARSFAARLGAQGRCDQPIALRLDRSPDLAVALLAALACGAPLVPLDPAHPADRVLGVLDDVGASRLATSRALATSLPAGFSGLVLDVAESAADAAAPQEFAVDPDSLAYLLYTSGSTGRPKGVAVSQKALLNHALAAVEAFGLTPEDRVLQFASSAFDVALEEMLPTWLAGGAVVFAPEGGTGPAIAPADLSAWARERRVTVLNLPASYWEEWLIEVERAPLGAGGISSLRLVVTGSEPVSRAGVERFRRLFGPEVALLGAYGLTEATITSILFDPRAPDGAAAWPTLPVGGPIANQRAYLLDEQGQPQPLDAFGELALGGDGLARGYLGQPALTAERFRPDPWGPPGSRLLATGDRARRLKHGALAVVGRLDRQVKVRGVRFEPAEIEAALRLHPAVKEVAVIARADRAGATRLIACAVAPDGPLPAGELRSLAAARLPAAAIPAHFVFLDRLPRTAGGKLDRAALARLVPAVAEGGSAPPANAVERVVAGVLAEMLEVEALGRDDDFFAAGGHSLLATRAVSRLQQVFQVRLPLREFFDGATVAAVAGTIERLEGAPGRSVRIAELALRVGAMSSEERSAAVSKLRAAGGGA